MFGPFGAAPAEYTHSVKDLLFGQELPLKGGLVLCLLERLVGAPVKPRPLHPAEVGGLNEQGWLTELFSDHVPALYRHCCHLLHDACKATLCRLAMGTELALQKAEVSTWRST